MNDGNNDNNGTTTTTPLSRGKTYRQVVQPIKRVVNLTTRKFDTTTLPSDQQRVYTKLTTDHGSEYALLFLFTMRTAIELHRAWNMTLLTSNVLQQIKDEFGLRMTWNLGVVRLIFRVEDGGFELHRKVPYDYDSEYQDIYYRIAMALIEGHITVDEALCYQSEVKRGEHTAAIGLFFRDYPGRLLVYPLLSSTCAVIFFNGTWLDAGVAAITGFASGLIEWGMGYIGGNASMLLDITVGLSTGLIGGLWYHYSGHPNCISAVFLGTLYWFFYGTAFVIGILEIMAGELTTGVTRFIAVSVKTFILSIGASIGLMIVSGGNAIDTWYESDKTYCDGDFISGQSWRIPLYLLCSVAVLGQYRCQLTRYWLALSVQLVAYEVQYTVTDTIDEYFTRDNLDSAVSNITGCAAGVVCACLLWSVANVIRRYFGARVLQNNEGENSSKMAIFSYKLMRLIVKVNSCFRIGRRSDIKKFELEETLKGKHRDLNDPNHPSESIDLSPEDEQLFLETIVSSQNINVWAILMPAVYQLVPGSVIAKFWFYAIFPPPIGGDLNNTREDVFSNLMVISASLALGLVVGFAIVQVMAWCFDKFYGCWYKDDTERIARRKHKQDQLQGMYTAADSPDNDPGSVRMESADQEDNHDHIL